MERAPFRAFVSAVRASHRDNAFHNFWRAADVTHAVRRPTAVRPCAPHTWLQPAAAACVRCAGAVRVRMRLCPKPSLAFCASFRFLRSLQMSVLLGAGGARALVADEDAYALLLAGAPRVPRTPRTPCWCSAHARAWHAKCTTLTHTRCVACFSAQRCVTTATTRA